MGAGRESARAILSSTVLVSDVDKTLVRQRRLDELTEEQRLLPNPSIQSVVDAARRFNDEHGIPQPDFTPWDAEKLEPDWTISSDYSRFYAYLLHIDPKLATRANILELCFRRRLEYKFIDTTLYKDTFPGLHRLKMMGLGAAIALTGNEGSKQSIDEPLGIAQLKCLPLIQHGLLEKDAWGGGIATKAEVLGLLSLASKVYSHSALYFGDDLVDLLDWKGYKEVRLNVSVSCLPQDRGSVDFALRIDPQLHVLPREKAGNGQYATTVLFVNDPLMRLAIAQQHLNWLLPRDLPTELVEQFAKELFHAIDIYPEERTDIANNRPFSDLLSFLVQDVTIMEQLESATVKTDIKVLEKFLLAHYFAGRCLSKNHRDVFKKYKKVLQKEIKDPLELM